jgi:hypothetical protein
MTLVSGKKWTPVLGKRDPYLSLSSSEASLGEPPSILCSAFFEEISLFSKFFMIFKNSSKFSLSSELIYKIYSNSFASNGSLPRLLNIV